MDFTFVCPTEIIAFYEAQAEFEKNNCSIIGCSVDSQFVHMKWCNTPKKLGGLGGVELTLLADVNKEVAEAYNCLIR